MNRLFIAMLTALTCAALRSAAMPGESSYPAEKNPVECEYYLTGYLAKKAARVMNEELFNRPFMFSAIEPVSGLAFKTLGLDAYIYTKKLRNLIFSAKKSPASPLPIEFAIQHFDGGELKKVLNDGMPDSTPTLWNTVWLRDNEMGMGYASLNAKFPLRADIDLLTGADIGLQSDPDHEGVQKYFRMHYYEGDVTFGIEVGLHIPCRRLKDFVHDSWYTINEPAHVIAPARTRCRLPVIMFTRPDNTLTDDD